MNNQPKYTLPTYIDPESLVLKNHIGVDCLCDVVTILDNAAVSLDMLLNDPAYSVPPGASRNKIILARDTVEFARKLADNTSNDLGVICSRQTEQAIKEFEMWQSQAQAAIGTLSNMGYTWSGGMLWRPPHGKTPDYILKADVPAKSAQEASHHD